MPSLLCRVRFFSASSNAVLGMVFLSALGCDQLMNSREALRGATGRTQTVSPHARKPSKDTGSLAVTVLPPEGISVSLDGEKIAIRSPCEAVGLVPGRHILEVRGMGRYSVTLPVDVRAGEVLRVPIALRSRQPKPFEEPTAPPVAAQSPPPTPSAQPIAKPSPTLSEAEKLIGVTPSPPPRPRAPPLGRKLPTPTSRPTTDPRFLAPVWLSITAQPAAPIVVDGQSADTSTVQLTRTQGTLVIGTMAMTYTLLPGQVAALVIPHEAARWFVGDTPIKSKSTVRIGRSPVPLRRIGVGTQGHQEAVLRRHL